MIAGAMILVWAIFGLVFSIADVNYGWPAQIAACVTGALMWFIARALLLADE